VCRSSSRAPRHPPPSVTHPDHGRHSQPPHTPNTTHTKQGIPIWAAWLRYVSFVYFGFNLLLKIQFAGQTYVSCGGGTGGLGSGGEAGTHVAVAAGSGHLAQSCAPVTDLQGALQLPTNPNESPALEVCVLLGMLVGLRLLVYICLRAKTKSA
jgi:hypothetical protein